MAQKKSQQANGGNARSQDEQIRQRTDEILGQLERLEQLRQPNPDPIQGKAELEEIKRMGSN